MEEFYQHIITDLKNQISLLADQKAVQVALNAMKQSEINKLQEEIKELKEAKEAPTE